MSPSLSLKLSHLSLSFLNAHVLTLVVGHVVVMRYE
jgi:hypothetical protein